MPCPILVFSYEDSAECDGNLNVHANNVRVCHECENAGDGVTGTKKLRHYFGRTLTLRP